MLVSIIADRGFFSIKNQMKKFPICFFLFASLAGMKVDSAELTAKYEVPRQVVFLDGLYSFNLMNVETQDGLCGNGYIVGPSYTYQLYCSPDAPYILSPLVVTLHTLFYSMDIVYEMKTGQGASLPIFVDVREIATLALYEKFITSTLQAALFDMFHYYHTTFAMRRCSICRKTLYHKQRFDFRVFLSCGHIFHLNCIGSKDPYRSEYILAKKCRICNREITDSNLIWREPHNWKFTFNHTFGPTQK